MMRRPSVLFINRIYPPERGATGRLLKDLAMAMMRDGWDVHVLSSAVRANQFVDNGITHIHVTSPKNPRTVLGSLKLWRRLLKAGLSYKADFDLVVSMTDPPCLVIAGDKIAQAKNARHIHWCQDVYPDLLNSLGVHIPYFIQNIVSRRTYKAIKACDKVVVLGRCMARYLGHQNVLHANMSVIPNWPDMELSSQAGREGFNDASGQKNSHSSDLMEGADIAQFRAPMHQVKDQTKFRILYAGNLGKAHPVDTILEAAERLYKTNPEIEFVFVGDGPVFDDIAEKRAHKRLPSVRLLPYQPLERLRITMESGDIHLISMNQDAAGLLVPSKLYSALAVGRPSILIGPDISETAMVLDEYKAGSVVAQSNPDDLVRAILKYRNDGDAWFAAHHAALKASKIYNSKDSIDAWIERAWAVIEDDLKGAFHG